MTISNFLVINDSWKDSHLKNNLAVQVVAVTITVMTTSPFRQLFKENYQNIENSIMNSYVSST